MAELSPDTSPYRFANNNPNFWSDPSGLSDDPPVTMSESNMSGTTIVKIRSSGGFGAMGFAIPNFFSWDSIRDGVNGTPPLPSFLGVVSVSYDITKVTQQLEPVEIEIDYKKLNDAIGAFGLATGIKETIIQAAVATNRGISISRVNNTSYLRVIGAGGFKYMKYVKGIGVAGSVLSTVYSGNQVYNQYKDGGVNEVLKHRDFVDTGAGVVGLGATALAAAGLISNPVGWGIGIGLLVYGGATIIYDAYNEP